MQESKKTWLAFRRPEQPRLARFPCLPPERRDRCVDRDISANDRMKARWIGLSFVENPVTPSDNGVNCQFAPYFALWKDFPFQKDDKTKKPNVKVGCSTGN